LHEAGTGKGSKEKTKTKTLEWGNSNPPFIGLGSGKVANKKEQGPKYQSRTLCEKADLDERTIRLWDENGRKSETHFRPGGETNEEGYFASGA